MSESLFSLELVVESVGNLRSVCRLPAVAFRLLDFPTLIIHHIPPQTAENIKSKLKLDSSWKPPSLEELKDRFGNYQIHKGKSCLFRMHHEELASLLENTPLYVMLIDVWPDKPKLVGSTSVPLRNCIANIHRDIVNRGVANPSVHGQSGSFELYNLMGSKIGEVSLSLRLLSLGGSLIPHIPVSSIMNRESEQNNISEEAREMAEKMLNDVKVAQIPEEILDEEENKDLLVNHDNKPLPNESYETPKCDHHTQTDNYAQKKKTFREENSQESVDNEAIVITNTICPPPLFYNSLAHPQKLSQRKEPKSYYASTVRKNGFQNYYNPGLGSVDVTPYIATQTCSEEELQPPAQRNGEVAITTQQENALHNLPLLNALLHELNALGVSTTLQSNGVNLERISERLATMQSANAKEHAAPLAQKKVEPDVKTTTKQLTGKKRGSVLGVQQRVKFKNSNLTYGTTRAQQMRLEKNRALLGKDGTKCEACSTMSGHYHTVKPRPGSPKRVTKQPRDSLSRRKPVVDIRPMVASVEVQTEENYEGLTSVDVQTDEKQIAPKPKKRTNRGKAKKILGKTYPVEFPDASTDMSRVFSPDESVPSFTSQNSMDIFLPTAEDDSDQGSDKESFKSAENDNNVNPPAVINNRYGATGITSPEPPQVVLPSADYSTYGFHDSKPWSDETKRGESSTSYHSVKSTNSQKSTNSVVTKPPIAKPRSKSFDRSSPTHLEPDQPILSARSPSVSRTSRLIRQTVLEREEENSHSEDSDSDSDSQCTGIKRERNVHKYGASASEDLSRVSTPLMRRSSVTSVDSEHRKSRTISQLSMRDYSEDFCSAESGSENEKEESIEDSLEMEQKVQGWK